MSLHAASHHSILSESINLTIAVCYDVASALYRLEKQQPCERALQSSPVGFFHLDIAEVRTKEAEGRVG